MDYVRALTDDTGLFQHSKYATPNKKEGYTTDDNARALIACTKYFTLFNDYSVKQLISTYLSLLYYMQRADGRMHNFLSFDRKFNDAIGSEDCIGRTIWACGYCLDSKLPEEMKFVFKDIFDKAFSWASSFTSPRAKAFTIMGLFHYQKAQPEDQNIKLNIIAFADQLTKQFKLESSTGWDWFESYLTYSNARLPHSLFLSYELTGKNEYLQVASKALTFLIRNQTINDVFSPIGNDGWYRKESNRALYDQQSIEASCTTEASIAAFRNTSDKFYLKSAHNAFDWFLGKNLQGLVLYDPENGSCYDGITPNGLNLNKGAEATIAYLMARLSIESKK
ncbi:MAG: glycosyltransferase [Crenarchaeota archaeon]|nr:glycosyltransferase [Thermoproteota archaeon]